MKNLPTLGGLVFVAVVAAASVVAAEDANPPNIVFIFTDDHAAHAMSCYGSKINETPNLDRIANEGMLFKNAFCTNSLCGPSRAVILTGKHSHINGFRDNRSRFDGSQQTFPKLLRKSGYQTAVIGKWHLVSDPTGFDYSEILVGQGPYYNPPMIKNGQRVQHTGYTTQIITDLAIDWLKNQRNEEQPFMMMFQHKAPHREWQPGPGYFEMYKKVEVPEPATLFDDYEGRGTAAKTQDMSIEKTLTELDLKLVPPRNLNEEQLAAWHAAYDEENEAFRKADLKGEDLIRWKYQRYIKDYLRCVAAVDDSVGTMLDYLDESGLAENTVVIYSSDQGFYLGDHGWFDKRFMYEESLRMPLLVRWPGVTKPGSVNDDLVQNLDYAETFLDIANAEIPNDMQGRSLVPLLKGETPEDWRDAIYYHYYEYPAVHAVQRHYGVRTQDHKLIDFYNLDEWELYDLKKDPDELRNVVEESQYQEVLADLKSKLAELREKYNVPEDTDAVPGPGKTRWPMGARPGADAPATGKPARKRAS